MSGCVGFLVTGYLYTMGNLMYMGLQFVVYIGYKIDAFVEACRLDHATCLLYGTPLSVLTVCIVSCVIGVVAILLAPILPYGTQTTCGSVWQGMYRAVFYTYECGSNSSMSTSWVGALFSPLGFVFWFLLLDALLLVV